MFRLATKLPTRNLQSAVGRQKRFTAGTPLNEGAKKSSFGIFSLLKVPFVQRVIRVGRVLVVSVMIYQAGYQNGMVHFAQDPAQVEDEMMKVSLGIPANEELSAHVHYEFSPLHRRVTKIGNRIISAAREHCNTQLKNSRAALKSMEGDEKITVQNWDALVEQEAMWARAVKRLDGKWTIILCTSPEINAFVTGMSPRKIFVFEGLIKRLNLTDDELAMIMGHELSHVILGHIEEQTPLSAIILGTQLVVMSMVDPLGLGSFFFDMFVSRLGTYVAASFSRQHESDADELGLLLTSLACFDIKAGANVHEKLSHFSGDHSTKLTDTHPSSMERKIVLAELALAHEADRATNPAFSQYQRDCLNKREEWALSIFAARKK